MSSLRELYQEVIIDHNRHPRNFREMAGANHCAHGHNPLCGDEIQIFLDIADGKIQDVSFQGQGCAISTASASLMTEQLIGKTIEQADAIFSDFHRMITEDDAGSTAAIGKLEILAGVKEFPTRVKCATLAWHTLHAALTSDEKPVSTE